jgi:hypothetical protein
MNLPTLLEKLDFCFQCKVVLFLDERTRSLGWTCPVCKYKNN